MFVLVLCNGSNIPSDKIVFMSDSDFNETVDKFENNQLEVFKREAERSENGRKSYEREVEEDFHESQRSFVEDEMREEVRSIMGEPQIRHGRSRNHFNRMSRDKKLNGLNSLHFIDQQYVHYAEETGRLAIPGTVLFKAFDLFSLAYLSGIINHFHSTLLFPFSRNIYLIFREYISYKLY